MIQYKIDLAKSSNLLQGSAAAVRSVKNLFILNNKLFPAPLMHVLTVYL